MDVRIGFRLGSTDTHCWLKPGLQNRLGFTFSQTRPWATLKVVSHGAVSDSGVGMIEILKMATALATNLVLLFLGFQAFRTFRRQRRPRLIINRAYSDDIQAPCLISNMSDEAIYLSTVFCAVEREGRWLISEVTNLASDDRSGEDSHVTFQGPIPPKHFYHFSGFDTLIRHTLDGHGHGLESWHGISAVEIRGVAVYGNEKYPLGVYRRFDIVPLQRSVVLIPASVNTQRLSRRWHQRRIQGWFSELAEG